MGNCIRKQHWRDENASSFHDRSGNSKGKGLEKSNLLGDSREPKGMDRVTVKVSKKQLQQLLKQAEVEGLSSDEVLSRLTVNVVGDSSEAHHRSWIPSLQSIPE